MHQRRVRVPAVGVTVRLSDGSGELVNMSITGALMRLDQELPVGTVEGLHLDGPPAPTTLSARVIRCEPLFGVGCSPRRRRWLIAVTFENLSPKVQEAILGIMISLHQRDASVRT